jgi:hypothetical protein
MYVDAYARRKDARGSMTFAAPDSATTNSMRIPSIVVLGADALLAALPATPIQLAHACALAGYHQVVPASWGDELIALASLRALRDHAHMPAIQCSCPYVAHRLLAVGTDLRPFLVSLVAPPVVLARYLRAAYAPRKLRITYVGRCPGAGDESIDARLTPDELLAIFRDHHIVVEDQPEVFDSVLPPDRRRYRSQPGGLPTPEMLWSAEGASGIARSVVELCGDELPVELAQHLLAGKPVLIDVAPKLGCVCSGATPDSNPLDARARITALEPPRASSPVIDERIATEATLPLPASPRSAIDVVSPPASPTSSLAGRSALPNEPARSDGEDVVLGGRPTTSESPTGGQAFSTRRHSPARGIARPVSGALPTARDVDGRQLPRTYVARRRFPVRGTRSTPAESQPAIPATPGTSASVVDNDVAPNERPRDDESSVPPSTGEPEPRREAAAPSAMPAGAFVSTADPSFTAAVPESSGPGIHPRGAVARGTSYDGDLETRFGERAVALPVTRLSDRRPREETAPLPVGDRPVMQILTVGLLIAVIVLVSAAVGVLVGRWMSQR